MRARLERRRRMRWRPRFESRTGTLLDVPAAALKRALPSLIAEVFRAAATFAWRRLEDPGSVIATVPLQPPESAGQATRTRATPEALIPTVCGGIVGGTELPAGGSTIGGSNTGGSTTGGSTMGSIGGSTTGGSTGTAGFVTAS